MEVDPLKVVVKKEDPGSEQIKMSTKIDWRPLLFRPGIYHWRYYSDEIQGFYEYSLDETHSPDTVDPENKCIKVELFKYPDEGYIDFLWKYHSWQQNLLGDYFHEAFEDWAFNENAKLQDLFTLLIIPKNIYYNIINKINDFELLHIKDLFLECIAISQYIITNELSYWNSPENKILRETVLDDTKAAIKVIELSGVHHKNTQSMIDNPSPGLSSITFAFKDKSKIRIQHTWLASEFVEHFMRYYDGLKNKAWRENLADYPSRFNRKRVKVSFQKQIVKAYYDLFSENKWFESKEDTKYPSVMMRCIACMLEFSLLPVGEEGYSDFRKGKNIAQLLKQIHAEKPQKSASQAE